MENVKFKGHECWDMYRCDIPVYNGEDEVIDEIDWDEVEERRAAGVYKSLGCENGWASDERLAKVGGKPVEGRELDKMARAHREWDWNKSLGRAEGPEPPRPNNWSKTLGRSYRAIFNDDLMVCSTIDSSD